MPAATMARTPREIPTIIPTLRAGGGERKSEVSSEIEGMAASDEACPAVVVVGSWAEASDGEIHIIISTDVTIHKRGAPAVSPATVAVDFSFGPKLLVFSADPSWLKIVKLPEKYRVRECVGEHEE